MDKTSFFKKNSKASLHLEKNTNELEHCIPSDFYK